MPYHLITNGKPDLSKLHIFWLACSPYLNNGKKLEPHKGYFVGYDECSPSYLVCYKEENKVIKHRVKNFTDKFEDAISDGYINEEFIEIILMKIMVLLKMKKILMVILVKRILIMVEIIMEILW